MNRGIELRVAGFPTTIQPMFLLVIGLIGWYPGVTAVRLALWVIVGVAAIMWHELGHATAARRLGAAPSIELYGLGGMTRWQPPQEPSRREMIGVSLAGPGAGFLVGGVTLIGVAVAGGSGSGDVGYLVRILLWTNIGWGLLNLLPVLPLDGGHVMAELLPGDRGARQRRAAMLSIAIGLLGAIVLIMNEIVFGGIIFGWIAFSNLSTMRSTQAQQARWDIEDEAQKALTDLANGAEGAVEGLLDLLARLRPHAAGLRTAAIETAVAIGNGAAARTLLDRAEPGEQLSPAMYALVFAAESGGRDGVAEMVEIYRREPTAHHARWMAVALHRAGRLDDLARMLSSAAVPVEPVVLAEAARAADNLGHPAAAAAVRAVGDA